MFKSHGKIEVNKGIRVNCDIDFLLYYRKLLNYYYFNTLKTQVPAYKAHISIILPDIHKDIDFLRAKHYDGLMVDFFYNPEEIIRSTKNIWLKIDLPIGDKIKKELNVIEKDFWGYHLVLGNWKQKLC